MNSGTEKGTEKIRCNCMNRHKLLVRLPWVCRKKLAPIRIIRVSVFSLLSVRSELGRKVVVVVCPFSGKPFSF